MIQITHSTRAIYALVTCLIVCVPSWARASTHGVDITKNTDLHSKNKIIPRLKLGHPLFEKPLQGTFRTIKGSVLTKDAEPLIGVNVLVKGTGQGTVTDIDGTFELDVPTDNLFLVLSYTGYNDLEVAIGESSTLSLIMEEGVSLEEVVVTAVGIEANKAALGYSIQNLDVSDLKTGEIDLVSNLTAKLPGVQVTSSSGEPGAATNIRIRGSASILGNNSPLFVIDGIPIDNSQIKRGSDRESIGGVNQSNRAIDINPADIDKMTILKGPAATVLYGVRAASGAVVINTKKGTNKELKIQFASQFGVSEVTALPQRQSTYAKGGNIDCCGPFLNTYTSGPPFSWGPRISELEFDGDPTFPFDNRGRLVPAGTGNGVPAEAYTNLFDKFYQRGISFDNHLSISGGTDKTSYYISGGHLEQTGTQRNTDFSRTSFRVNLQNELSEKFSLNSSVYYANSGSDNRALRGQDRSGQGIGLYFNATTFDPSNGLSGDEAWRTSSTWLTPDGQRRAQEYDNPYFNVARNKNSDNVNRVIASIAPSYQINKNFKLVYRLGYDQYTDEQLQFYDIGAFEVGYAGSIRELQISSRDLNSDFLLFYNSQLADKISLEAIVGHNYYQKESGITGLRGAPIGTPGLMSLSNAQSIVETWDEDFNRALAGVFADFKFRINNQLYINLSGRNDWSSTLPEGDNSIFYPSVSVGLDATEMFGVSNASFLSYAKLRGSWGQVGNDAPIYSTNNSFNRASVGGDSETRPYVFPYLGVNGFELNSFEGNNNLVPELTETFEIGGDFKFLKGKLTLDVTYYDSKTTNQILPVTISAASGFTGQITNAGSVTNRGVEIYMEATPIRKDNFTWALTANFTRNRSMVEALAPGVDNIALHFPVQGEVFSSATVGQPFGAIFGTRYLRNENGQKVIGENGWPIEDTELGIVGDPNPNWLAGLRNTFSYKNFSLTALLDFRKGGDIWNGTKAIMNGFGVGKETEIRENSVVFEGVKADGTPNTTEVSYVTRGPGPPTFINAYWFRYGIVHVTEENIQSVDWVRLREVGLSYQFSDQWFKGLLRGSSISFIGRNLWLSTNYDGIDPEVNQASQTNGLGLDYLNSPNTRSYSVRLNLVF